MALSEINSILASADGKDEGMQVAHTILQVHGLHYS